MLFPSTVQSLLRLRFTEKADAKICGVALRLNNMTEKYVLSIEKVQNPPCRGVNMILFA